MLPPKFEKPATNFPLATNIYQKKVQRAIQAEVFGRRDGDGKRSTNPG